MNRTVSTEVIITNLEEDIARVRGSLLAEVGDPCELRGR